MRMTEGDQDWCLAEKTAPVWAKKLKKTSRIETLEGILTFEKGCFLCKGPHNDLWGQTEKQMQRKYTADPKAVKKDGWQKFIPIPGQCRVLAKQMQHDFFVESPMGKLNGKAGDYLVKSVHGEKSDIMQWIVDENIFKDTYSFIIKV